MTAEQQSLFEQPSQEPEMDTSAVAARIAANARPYIPEDRTSEAARDQGWGHPIESDDDGVTEDPLETASGLEVSRAATTSTARNSGQAALTGALPALEEARAALRRAGADGSMTQRDTSRDTLVYTMHRRGHRS